MAKKKQKKLSEKIVVEEVPVEVVEEKKFSAELEQKSVVATPDARENATPTASFLYLVSSVADTITPWGTHVKQRDSELREFVVTEPILSSALYSTCVRNASFKWGIVPSDPGMPEPKNTIRAATRMLKNSNRGKGWIDLILRTCYDIYSQDNASFWELIRKTNDPASPVINVAHLDSARCFRTGDPETPVIYHDRYGVFHRMKHYQVITIEEFPAPIENLFGVQVCAVSRALRAAQILRDVEIYKHEKVSGRWARSIDLVGGITKTEIEDAYKEATANMDNAGLLRFNPRMIVAGVDPTNAVSHESIDLASLPDHFNFEEEMKWYVTILAMAFGVDYQEFAPLPSGALGSGQQSEILHMKTRGKGPAMIMGLFESILNDNGILPNTIKFEFKVHDSQAEESQANARFLRGKDRALRIQSGELDLIAARKVAIEDGDLADHLAEEMDERGVETDGENVPPGAGGIPTQEDGGQNMTANNIDTGRESREERKAFPPNMEALPTEGLPDISEDDVETERQSLGRFLLGAV